MLDNENSEEAELKAQEIIDLHLSENSDERITIAAGMTISDFLNPDSFNNLQRTCIQMLNEKYEIFKQSEKYYSLLNTLNLEVKQYIVLRKAGLIQ